MPGRNRLPDAADRADVTKPTEEVLSGCPSPDKHGLAGVEQRSVQFVGLAVRTLPRQEAPQLRYEPRREKHFTAPAALCRGRVQRHPPTDIAPVWGHVTHVEAQEFGQAQSGAERHRVLIRDEHNKVRFELGEEGFIFYDQEEKPWAVLDLATTGASPCSLPPRLVHDPSRNPPHRRLRLGA